MIFRYFLCIFCPSKCWRVRKYWLDMIWHDGWNQQPCVFLLCHEALHYKSSCAHEASKFLAKVYLPRYQPIVMYASLQKSYIYYFFKSSIQSPMSPKKSLILNEILTKQKRCEEVNGFTHPICVLFLAKIWSDLETVYGHLTPCKSILVQGSKTGTTAAEKNGGSWVFQVGRCNGCWILIACVYIFSWTHIYI